ncbi:hypothetical protein EJ110_NYTH11695 [Nymphaea thermarum]|nr:hypothetical protein EJ110_NYTH11695 [Nymphaea thermarum]
MYEGGRSGITGRKRRETTDTRARRGMRPPSGRVPTGRLADNDDRPSIEYLYEAMDKAKENLGQPAAVGARTTMRPAEATEGFVDEGESATAEYVGEDLPILDDKDEDEDEEEEEEEEEEKEEEDEDYE